MRPPVVAVPAAVGYLTFAILWHLAANHISDDHAVIRALAKGACLTAAGLLFLIVTVRLTASSPERELLRGAIWSAGAVAAAAFGTALFDGWRTSWGETCNQCDPAHAIIALPAFGGAVALLGAIAVGWLAVGVRRAIERTRTPRDTRKLRRVTGPRMAQALEQVTTPAPDLQIAAARYVVGLLPSWEIKEIANLVLDQGIYSYALGELATARTLVMADAGPLFEQALHDLQIEIPSSEAAWWTLLRHHINRIAVRDVTPHEGLRVVVDLYDLAGFHGRNRQYVGDSHDLQHLIGAFWGYDDLAQRPREVSYAGLYGADAFRALDAEVVRLATKWVDEHRA